MTKTDYDQFFKRTEKKIEKSSVNPIAAFDHKNEINYNAIQNKSKKN